MVMVLFYQQIKICDAEFDGDHVYGINRICILEIFAVEC